MGAIEKWKSGGYGNQTRQTNTSRRFRNTIGKQFIYTRNRTPNQSLEVKQVKGTYIEISKVKSSTGWGQSGGSVTKTPVDQEYYLKLEKLANEARARRQGPRVECHCE